MVWVPMGRQNQSGKAKTQSQKYELYFCSVLQCVAVKPELTNEGKLIRGGKSLRQRRGQIYKETFLSLCLSQSSLAFPFCAIFTSFFLSFFKVENPRLTYYGH